MSGVPGASDGMDAAAAVVIPSGSRPATRFMDWVNGICAPKCTHKPVMRPCFTSPPEACPETEEDITDFFASLTALTGIMVSHDNSPQETVAADIVTRVRAIYESDDGALKGTTFGKALARFLEGAIQYEVAHKVDLHEQSMDTALDEVKDALDTLERRGVKGDFLQNKLFPAYKRAASRIVREDGDRFVKRLRMSVLGTEEEESDGVASEAGSV